ncbi:hypothetical protein [Bacillus pumilus]|uniref:hypothetical protein n=1 Tax=Bacillus pumilus TaxID=1408 RepID=UPI0021B6CD1E|nr:hypothetical protein [Bacillus pumilus]
MTTIIISGEISVPTIIVNFIVVIALFFVIKYLLYKKDQATAAEINKLLQNREKRMTPLSCILGLSFDMLGKFDGGSCMIPLL